MSAPLRVLWLIKGLGPGGAEQLLVNQAGAHAPDALDIRVGYLVPWKDHHVGPLEAHGIAVRNLHGPREWDPRWAWRLRRWLLADPVDVVHVHSPYVAAFTRLVVMTVPRDRRPGLVYTEHNRWARHRPSTRWANRLTFAFDDHHLAVSDDVRDTVHAGARHRVEVLVHGVDVAAVRAQAHCRNEVRAELGVHPDDVVVGVVANFRREKAYPDLLDAAAVALRAHPGLHVVAVGQGPLESAMRERLHSMDLGDRVQLLGYRADAVRVMSSFDIFTLASTHEGLPVSLMDALVLGMPVVATAVGGIPQIITDGVEGRLVRPGHPEELAEAWGELIGDPDRRAEMAAAAAARGADFDVARAAKRLEQIYADVAERASNRR
jgi:glycosyltransferase involved in cell wall biosynthesis